MFKLNIKTTNIELTTALSEYSEKKFNGIDKFVRGGQNILNFQLELAKTTNHHKNGDIFRAEVTMNVDGKNFYAFSETSDLYSSIDEVKEEIIQEVTKSRGRARALFRKGAAKIKSLLRM